MRRSLMTALLGLALAASATPAFAGKDGTVAERGASFGVRAAYFDPKQDGADSTWFGGAQLRFYLSEHFGLEASGDYRQNDLGADITVKTYPVQASLLAYII